MDHLLVHAREIDFEYEVGGKSVEWHILAFYITMVYQVLLAKIRLMFDRYDFVLCLSR